MCKLNILTLILFLGQFSVSAQIGISTASVSMNRTNGISSPDQVLVEEYINYHEHNIDLPSKDEEVALSLEYNQLTESDYILQIGLATNKILDYSDMPPVNVSLVIDKSGSMQIDGRLEKVKKALLKFSKGLRPQDYISIITYDNEAKVVLASTKINELRYFDNIIESITAGGSTNLNGGLILGYKQVEKHYNSKYTNKVILLTDGVANVGITNLEEIVSNSFEYNQKGIEISTIGVGNNLNYQLLQQLAKKGNGSNHFVGNKEYDIVKVFDLELESLLSSIGKNVYLSLTLPQGLEVQKLYGYSPKYNGNQINIPLENINSGLTQVVMSEIKMTKDLLSKPIRVRLHYTTPTGNKYQISDRIKILQSNDYPKLSNEIEKNYWISKMADSLKKMAQFKSESKYDKAWSVVNTAITDIDKRFKYLKDKDILRVKDILEDNRDQLRTNKKQLGMY